MSVAAEAWSGFADPVLDAQSVFRSIMTAMACPGTVADLASDGLRPPRPLTPALAAVALTLCDHETPVWLDSDLGVSPSVARYIQFYTGAPLVADPADAAFAFAVDLKALPPLAAFAQGSDEYPDRSTTLVLAVEALGSGGALTLAGPGIEERATFALWPLAKNSDAQVDRMALLEGFIAGLIDNHARFPRGVDCVFAAAGKVAALPRSTRIAIDHPEASERKGA
jgi:alpha-D-ribose 1-methylphosphonate 5-triphosphate synthase subunit PhnH